MRKERREAVQLMIDALRTSAAKTVQSFADRGIPVTLTSTLQHMAAEMMADLLDDLNILTDIKVSEVIEEIERMKMEEEDDS